jgi:hypothetical protein
MAGMQCQLLPAADMSCHTPWAAMGPLPDQVRRSKTLFDDLVGAGEHNLSVTAQPTTISLIWICGEISV